MRTTMTLDPDVAAQIAERRRASGQPLRQVVNDLLRAGLLATEQTLASAPPYSTPSVSLGRCLAGPIDNVHEVLSLAEGDNRT